MISVEGGIEDAENAVKCLLLDLPEQKQGLSSFLFLGSDRFKALAQICLVSGKQISQMQVKMATK